MSPSYEVGLALLSTGVPGRRTRGEWRRRRERQEKGLSKGGLPLEYHCYYYYYYYHQEHHHNYYYCYYYYYYHYYPYPPGQWQSPTRCR